ncbi:hypothetical protein ElyMa_005710900 [Elysia marginata]|uniref:Uncharacterized protein n=1 Tax=Elysia marginata TaxID=1093978 RepID=A0AAV4FIB9_9GAST|nr:hypothetical protein ElyMa_005710900 [Elysia marginata]
MPHPGKTISPHGVEKPLLGVGVFGAGIYFRQWMPKISRLTKRCVSLSAVLLALCVWLSLITVMTVAPIQPGGPIERGAAAATLKEDANFFMRSVEPSDNSGSYPGRAGIRKGYLSSIDMQHEKLGKGLSGNDDEETAPPINLERQAHSQKLDRKMITRSDVWASSIAKDVADNADFDRSNINNVIKSRGVGRRRIQGFKTEETKEFETSLFPRFRGEDRGRGVRQHVINNGPILISEIKSSRQAPCQKLGNSPSNLSPKEERRQNTGGSLKAADRREGDDIPEQDCPPQTHGKPNFEMPSSDKPTFHDENKLPLGIVHTSLPPLNNVLQETVTPVVFLQLYKNLIDQRLQTVKKSSSHWPSGSNKDHHNQGGHFYDGLKGTREINRHSANPYDSSRAPCTRKIEVYNADSILHSSTPRRAVGTKNNRYPTLPIVKPRRAVVVVSETKHGESAIVNSLKPSEGENTELLSTDSDSFQPSTQQQNIEHAGQSERNRQALRPAVDGVNSEINLGHSITRQRQRYNDAQDSMGDRLYPPGMEQPVETGRASSVRGSSLTSDTTSGQKPFSGFSQTPGRQGKKRYPLYGANLFVRMDGINDTSRHLSSNGAQSDAFKKETSRRQGSRGQVDSKIEQGKEQASWNVSGVLINDGFDFYSYNVTASDAIPLNRSIPDTRPKG